MIILGALIIALGLAYICFAVWLGLKLSDFVSDDMSLFGLIVYLTTICLCIGIASQILYWIFG